MTAAVRAILTPFYWLAVVVVWLAVTPLLLPPLGSLHGWQADLGGGVAGAVIPVAAMLAEGPILGCCTRYVARHVEMFAAEWRKLLAAPPLPPPGGMIDGPAGPPSERLTP